jgi:hypothetical protein
MKLFLVYSLLCFTLAASSQGIENVLNSSGKQAEDNRGNTVTFSIGEAVIDGRVDSPYVATQGVIQHEIIIQTGQVEITELQLSVYPNPTSRILHLNYSEDISQLSIQLFDLQGKLVEYPLSIDGNQAVLDLSELAAAQYQLVVQKQNFKNTYKILKSH